MADPFARMNERLMARLGSPGILRGGQVTEVGALVDIQHGVAITGEYGEAVTFRSVAIIPTAADPRIGDSLTVGNADYVLDALYVNDGFSMRFILR